MGRAKIDEASSEGNRRWMDERARQPKLDTDEEKEEASRNRIIICSGDQLTTSRLRGLKTSDPWMTTHTSSSVGWSQSSDGSTPRRRSLHPYTSNIKAQRQALGLREPSSCWVRGVGISKVEGNWFHNFEESLKEIAMAQLLCTWLETTSASSSRIFIQSHQRG